MRMMVLVAVMVVKMMLKIDAKFSGDVGPDADASS
jgi:hypothetical protein